MGKPRAGWPAMCSYNAHELIQIIILQISSLPLFIREIYAAGKASLERLNNFMRT